MLIPHKFQIKQHSFIFTNVLTTHKNYFILMETFRTSSLFECERSEWRLNHSQVNGGMGPDSDIMWSAVFYMRILLIVMSMIFQQKESNWVIEWNKPVVWEHGLSVRYDHWPSAGHPPSSLRFSDGNDALYLLSLCSTRTPNLHWRCTQRSTDDSLLFPVETTTAYDRGLIDNQSTNLSSNPPGGAAKEAPRLWRHTWTQVIERNRSPRDDFHREFQFMFLRLISVHPTEWMSQAIDVKVGERKRLWE